MSNNEIDRRSIRNGWTFAGAINTSTVSFASYAQTAESSPKISAGLVLFSGFLSLALHTAAYRIDLRSQRRRMQQNSHNVSHSLTPLDQPIQSIPQAQPLELPTTS